MAMAVNSLRIEAGKAVEVENRDSCHGFASRSLDRGHLARALLCG